MTILTGDHWRIMVGDVRETLATLPAGSIHCCMTSPPYWGLRDYGFDGQIGSEKTPDEFVSTMVDVFGQVKRVLRDDGVLWLNLGDSYADDTKWGGSTGGKHVKGLHGQPVGRGKKQSGIPAGNLIGIPWRVALALQADGWILRQCVCWCLSGGTWLYARTEKGDAPAMLKDLVRLDPRKVQLWNGQKWTQVTAWTENKTAVASRDGLLEIEFRNGERIGCTSEHLWPTQRGLLRADQLVVGDVIPECRLPEPETTKDLCLSKHDLGWLVGFYLAEGMRFEKGMRFAIHASEVGAFDRIRRLAELVDGTAQMRLVGNNGGVIDVYSKTLAEMVYQYCPGDSCKTKRLGRKAWMQTDEFLLGVLNGYLEGDGHFDRKNNRWRLGFSNNDGLAVDIRALSARLGIACRLKRVVHTCQTGRFPGWKGEIRFRISSHQSSKPNGQIVAIRRSRARCFWDVSVADEPHTFALASGLLTHNCKRSPMPESVSGWQWKRCRVKVAKGIQGDPIVNGMKDHSGDIRNTESPQWSDCPGCHKCEPNNGYILRKGSWRPTTSHEFVFMLVKQPGYFSDGDGSAEKAVGGAKGSRFDHGKTGERTGGDRTQAGERDSDNSETRNQRSVWTLSSEPFKGAHFATFPTELVRRCLISSISPGGCCSSCGSQYAPVVEKQRTATRPGTNSKVNRASEHDDSPYNGHSGSVVGNRDPQRHTTTSVILEYRATCTCNAPATRPVVLDCFAGSCTTGQVAINMGAEFIGCEGNPDYAQLGVARLHTPWAPRAEKKPSQRKTKKNNRQSIQDNGVQMRLWES